ncbi:hypothetical protein EPUS_01303 [Endocarpon pusillum Z07020]|uniref:Choline transport protein n=1 Tax=Endocarpon pusillum (strain Z07020 / HMAS-L-300199) TaxID=1263415 RepID=U1GE93_ENDPU|nr:uncharacterized protein EPUS_01303 [Endocarpon pusillum Z07020]ERF75937.1 hypothetical protein EPUS_01303 [Endocarpon pusillum Z07020]
MADDKPMEMGSRTKVSKPSVHEAISDNTNDQIYDSGRNVLERYLGLKPMVSFGLTLQASWEAIAITFQAALLNGGPVSLVYGMILSAVGSAALAASLGEMASIDPTVGAQYRWTALYAPRVMSPAFWSLLQGWLTVFAWIASCALTPFLLGTMVQGLIIFNYPDTYIYERWHGTLLSWAFIVVPVICNVHGRRLLAPLEIIGGVCHLLFFICTVVILVVLATRSTAEFVFTTHVNEISGWTNPGVAWCIGLLSTTFPLVGFDGVLHMSDEAKDAPRRIPLSMILTVVINAVFAFAFIICLLFTLGDLETVLASPTGYPIIEVYYQATKSKAGTNVMMLMIIIVVLVSCFSILASVSRLTWAFAKDHGLPFADFFAYVHPGLKIPLRSLTLVTILSCLLHLISIGSTTAFTAILSLTTLALYISYLVPISLILLRKLEGRHPAYGPFRLGRWGIPINIFALLYGIFIVIWLPFPPVLPVTALNMNYAGPVMIAVIIIALLDWVISGHKRFSVPVMKENL